MKPRFDVCSLLELVKGIVASPAVSPLISEGVLDLDKLLDIAAIPKGKDIAGALERVKALAASMLPMAGVPGIGMPGQLPALPGTVGGGQSADPATDAIASTATDVAATALNGAQISSLIEIITTAAAGGLPLATVRPLIEQSFPMFSGEAIDRIVKSMAGFSSQGAPAPTPPTQMSTVPSSTPGPAQPDVVQELADRIAAGRAQLAETLGGSQDWGSL